MAEDAASPSEQVSVRWLTAPSSTELEALADLFDLYRVHYGQVPDAVGSRTWLEQNLRSGRISAFVADVNGKFVGFVVTVEIPASLRLSHFWQIRDLFVLSTHRRRGVGQALLDSVRAAATSSGALRLALQTEERNDPALALYISSGYMPVSGYLALALPID